MFALLLLFSCSRNEVFFAFQPIPSNGWGVKDTLFFRPVIEDTVSAYDVFIEVRNDNRYAYQNLWLYVTDSIGKDSLQTVPVEVLLANDFGKWNGKGFSFVYELSVPYLQNIRFPHAGEYPIAIRHGMENDPLAGIKNIGVRIVKL